MYAHVHSVASKKATVIRVFVFPVCIQASLSVYSVCFSSKLWVLSFFIYACQLSSILSSILDIHTWANSGVENGYFLSCMFTCFDWSTCGSQPIHSKNTQQAMIPFSPETKTFFDLFCTKLKDSNGNQPINVRRKLTAVLLEGAFEQAYMPISR